MIYSFPFSPFSKGGVRGGFILRGIFGPGEICRESEEIFGS